MLEVNNVYSKVDFYTGINKLEFYIGKTRSTFALVKFYIGINKLEF